jgi:hypothetical protein
MEVVTLTIDAPDPPPLRATMLTTEAGVLEATFTVTVMGS